MTLNELSNANGLIMQRQKIGEITRILITIPYYSSHNNRGSSSRNCITNYDQITNITNYDRYGKTKFTKLSKSINQVCILIIKSKHLLDIRHMQRSAKEMLLPFRKQVNQYNNNPNHNYHIHHTSLYDSNQVTHEL